MFQSSFQSPRTQFRGAPDNTSMLSMPASHGRTNRSPKQPRQVNPNYPFFYPQYMQEKEANGFLSKFSHFPFLPSTMSTTAKGLCGLITTLMSILIITIVVGLTPLYIRAAESSGQKLDTLQEFSIDLKNGLEFDDPSIGRILAKREIDRTPDEQTNLKSKIEQLTKELNEKTKSKLNDQISDIYNVRFGLNGNESISVSYTLKTDPLSKAEADIVKRSLNQKFLDPTLYDDVDIDINKNSQSTKSISNLIAGDVLKSGIKGDLKGSEYQEMSKEEQIYASNYNRINKKPCENDEKDSPYDKNRELEDLRKGSILNPKPYETYTAKPNYKADKKEDYSDADKQYDTGYGDNTEHYDSQRFQRFRDALTRFREKIHSHKAGYSSGNSYEKDDYKKDNYKKEDYKKDDYKKDDYKQDDYKQDDYEKEDYKKDDYKNDDYKQDDYEKDDYKKDDYKKDDYKQNNYKKDDYKKDDYKQENYKQDNYEKDDYKKDDYKKEEYRKDDHKANDYDQKDYKQTVYKQSNYKMNDQKEASYQMKDYKATENTHNNNNNDYNKPTRYLQKRVGSLNIKLAGLRRDYHSCQKSSDAYLKSSKNGNALLKGGFFENFLKQTDDKKDTKFQNAFNGLKEYVKDYKLNKDNYDREYKDTNVYETYDKNDNANILNSAISRLENNIEKTADKLQACQSYNKLYANKNLKLNIEEESDLQRLKPTTKTTTTFVPTTTTNTTAAVTSTSTAP